MSVYFHGSFGLNRDYLSKILEAGLKNPELTDLELAQPFGYKAPFTSRQRAWLYRAGVTEKGLPLKLTEFGEVLMKKDPGLKSDVTKWFIHHQLTSDPERAEVWHFFTYKFLPKHKEFTKEQLFMGLVEQLSPHSEKHFGMMSSMNKVIIRKLLECYLEDGALGSLGFLSKEGKKYISNAPKLEGPWDTPEQLMKALS